MVKTAEYAIKIRQDSLNYFFIQNQTGVGQRNITMFNILEKLLINLSRIPEFNLNSANTRKLSYELCVAVRAEGGEAVGGGLSLKFQV
jgi:hypothetical protein